MIILLSMLFMSYSDVSSTEVMLDSFLAYDGLTFSEFSDQYTGNELPGNYGWGQSRRWYVRMYDWESEIPAMRGVSRLLSMLQLTREQNCYLNELTNYVQYQLESIRSINQDDSDRMDFFTAFTEDFYMETTVYFAFEESSWYQSEMNDIMAWTMGMVNDMLTVQQLEDARRIVESELPAWNVRNGWSDWHNSWRNDPRRDNGYPGGKPFTR